MHDLEANKPNSAAFRRTVGGGGLILLHGHRIRPNEDHAGIEIFGLSNHGKSVEHRDVSRTVSETSANENGML